MMLQKKFLCKFFMFSAIMLFFLSIPFVVNALTDPSDFYFDTNTGTIKGYRGIASTIYIPAVINEVEVKAIGDEAFANRSNIRSVSIPNSVTTISDTSFIECWNLIEINVDPANLKYLSEDGVLFNKDKTKIIKYPQGRIAKTYSLPNSVTSIGFEAFGGCKSLTSISIPESVTSISTEAFARCSGLTSISIPDSVTSIGNSAFGGCDGLTSISIPNSVTSIGDGAFFACNGLISIDLPKSITKIGDDSFAYCDSLTSINIPNSVSSIGRSAFLCSGLTSIRIPESVTSIDYYAFMGCKKLTSISIPNSVTSIAPQAFTQCSGLTSISIPDSIKTIDPFTFYLCTSLTNVNIPNSVISIGDGAFSECTNLTSVSIPDSVTSIGSWAFSDSGLTSIRIPEGVTTIGNEAFARCKALTSVSIPNSVTSIGNDTFIDSFNLTIFSYMDSYAQAYAISKNINFRVLTDARISGTLEPDFLYTTLVAPKIKYGFKIEVVGQSISTYTDVNGNFEFVLPYSITMCYIKISKPGYLTKELKNISINQDLQLSPVTMWAGDINGDNAINMSDIMKIATVFNSIGEDGRYNAEYDFNKDAAINIADIMIIVKHFNVASY